MRINVFQVRDGRMTLSFPMLAAVLVSVPALLIGAVEVFWFLFTGGTSQLIGGFALVASILVLIRLIGESFSVAARIRESVLNRN